MGRAMIASFAVELTVGLAVEACIAVAVVWVFMWSIRPPKGD